MKTNLLEKITPETSFFKLNGMFFDIINCMRDNLGYTVTYDGVEYKTEDVIYKLKEVLEAQREEEWNDWREWCDKTYEKKFFKMRDYGK